VNPGRNNSRYQQRPHSTLGGVVVGDPCFQKAMVILHEGDDGDDALLLVATAIRGRNHVDERVCHLQESFFTFHSADKVRCKVCVRMGWLGTKSGDRCELLHF
jgi:hypothetical protein